MIRYLKNIEIDRGKWDECIAGSVNETIYPYSWYLDVVSPKWDALVLDDYQAVFPLTQKSKHGINYLIQPSSCQQLGIFSSKKTDADLFLEAIPGKFKFIDIKLNIINNPASGNFQLKENHTYELDLKKDYDSLYKGYSENVKRNIKKALSGNLTIKENIDPLLIIDLYRKNQGAKLKHPENAYKTLESVVKTLVAKEKAIIKGVFTKDGSLCAGAYFVNSLKKSIFLFSSTNTEAKSNGAMHMLIDAHIRENAGKNLVFDFEGSNEPGLARFYSSFGSEKKTYFSVKKNRLPVLLRVLKK